MFILKVDVQDPEKDAIRRAVATLRSGGLVIYPTETAYALGCDPRSRAAVKRSFALKKRDPSKPLPLIAASAAMAARFLKLDPAGRALTRAFWPGPLTLVGPGGAGFASGVASKQGEIALRVSSSPVSRALSRALGAPIVSTSANRSGSATCFDVLSVIAGLGAGPDLVLDGGPLKEGPTSTIVSVSEGLVAILREGAISENALRRALIKDR